MLSQSQPSMIYRPKFSRTFELVKVARIRVLRSAEDDASDGVLSELFDHDVFV